MAVRKPSAFPGPYSAELVGVDLSSTQKKHQQKHQKN